MPTVFNIYYHSPSEGSVCFTDVPRTEVLEVTGRILDDGCEITGIINVEDD